MLQALSREQFLTTDSLISEKQGKCTRHAILPTLMRHYLDVAKYFSPMDCNLSKLSVPLISLVINASLGRQAQWAAFVV